ncbi:uncharacterized protein M6B38_401485 [Iris pallida]|uniref:Protein BYPASS-related n=1 Tax=Iris pallida TaxID=29817 RepID=A0AAX6FU06_IRIPA|nr:uncharacterized protein M6B38_401485 [Iris pallida]
MQVQSMDDHDLPESSDPVLFFERHVSSFLLLLSSGEQILSLSWINKLLHSFLPLLDGFHSLVLSSSAKLPNCPPLDRSLSDFSDRSVKALDLLNAVRDGLARVRHVRSHLDAAVSAVRSSQLLRARKLLADLSSLLAATDADSAVPAHHSHRSFNQRHQQLQTLSWSVSVSRTWSASRQLQALEGSLAPPIAADVSATSGLAVPVFAMSSVLLFVLWALVAAVQCQDRGSLHAHGPAPSPPPRGYPWAAAMASLQEKVLGECKRRERKSHKASGGGGGLMKEICRVENAARNLSEMLAKERSEGREVEEEVRELEEARNGMKEGLEAAERQVRELFCRIVRYRTQGLDCSRRT